MAAQEDRPLCGDFGGKTARGKPCKRASFDGGMCGEHQGLYKAGRKPRDIDEHAVRRLAEIGCTYVEMGYILGADQETISARFAETVETGRAKTKASLRRAQLRMALGDPENDIAPHPTMLIWLGKNELGQTDRQQHEHSGPGGGPIQTEDVTELSDDDLLGRATQLGGRLARLVPVKANGARHKNGAPK